MGQCVWVDVEHVIYYGSRFDVSAIWFFTWLARLCCIRFGSLHFSLPSIKPDLLAETYRPIDLNENVYFGAVMMSVWFYDLYIKWFWFNEANRFELWTFLHGNKRTMVLHTTHSTHGFCGTEKKISEEKQDCRHDYYYRYYGHETSITHCK